MFRKDKFDKKIKQMEKDFLRYKKLIGCDIISRTGVGSCNLSTLEIEIEGISLCVIESILIFPNYVYFRASKNNHLYYENKFVEEKTENMYRMMCDFHKRMTEELKLIYEGAIKERNRLKVSEKEKKEEHGRNMEEVYINLCKKLEVDDNKKEI